MSAPVQPKPDLRDLSGGSDLGAARARLVETGLGLSRLLALLALFTGLAGAVGRILQVPIFSGAYPLAMKPNTALGLVLGAAAVFLSARGVRGRSAVRSLIVCCLATIVLLLGALTTIEHAFGLDLGLDRLFVAAPSTPIDLYPGRPSPLAAVGLALLGACLLWFELSPPRFILAGQIGLVLVAADAVVALTGHVFGVSALYLFTLRGAFMVMSITTALGFLMLSTALLCSRPNEGIMTLISSGSHSGAIARRIVLFLILGPPLVGFVTLMGVDAGLYDQGVQAALSALIILSLLLWNTWQAARQGERGELLAQAATAAVKSARDDFEERLEFGPDGVFVTDREGRYTNVNSAGARMLGYTPDEIIGRTIREFIPPEDSKRLERTKDQLLRGNLEVGEWLLRKKDGAYLPVEVSAKVLPDGRLQAFVRDIAERKQIERRLRYSEAKFSGIVSISADAIIQIDENQRIVMFNRGAEKVFGYAAGEVLGRSLDILIPERMRAIHRRHIADFAAGPDVSRPIGSPRAPIVGLRKGGQEFPADAAVSKLTIENDKILVAALRDSTAQKRVEAEQRFLAEAGAVLTAAALDYEDAVERIADLAIRDVADACMVDMLGPDELPHRRKVVSRDPSKIPACEALARAPVDAAYLEPIILDTPEILLWSDVPPDAIESLARSEAAREAWRGLEPKSMIVIPVVARQRVVVVISLISSTPQTFTAADRRAAEALAYRIATAIENIFLYRDLRQAVRSREHVLAIVSHDLRNPLTAMATMAGLLRATEAPGKEKLEKYARALHLSVDQMKRLIDDLLDFSTMQSGTFTVRKRTERPAEVIAEIVDGFRSQAETHGLTLTAHGVDDLPEVECDRRRVAQALSNLVVNAFKFTPEGGAISVSARVEADELVLTVSDTGRGIPAEQLPRIFDRYWQAEDARDMGAGLGLAIVKGIAEAHGGRAWAESRPGVGSTFCLALPLNRR
jgi:PAS domain S-box-containing protein